MDIREALISTQCVIDNAYLEKYVDLISTKGVRERVPTKTSSHHIIPKSYYKCKGWEIDNSKNNLVNLYHKDHLLAHYYMAMFFKGVVEYSMKHAFCQMMREFGVRFGPIDSQLLDEMGQEALIRQRFCEMQSERRKGKVPWNKGLTKDDVRVRKQWESRRSKGFKISEEQRLKQSLSHKGVISVMKDDNLKYVKKELLPEYLKNGWEIKGKRVEESVRKKIADTLRGRKWSEDSRINHMKACKDPEYLRKCSAGRKGKEVSSATRAKISAGIKGKHWYNNGTTNVFAKECPENFSPGMIYTKALREEVILKLKQSRGPNFNYATNKGKIVVFKGGTKKFIYPSELDTWLEEGWTKNNQLSG